MNDAIYESQRVHPLAKKIFSAYRFLGLICARDEKEFCYFYSLGTSSNSKMGIGLWNVMYPSEERKEYHRNKVREYRKKKQEAGK